MPDKPLLVNSEAQKSRPEVSTLLRSKQKTKKKKAWVTEGSLVEKEAITSVLAVKYRGGRRL